MKHRSRNTSQVVSDFTKLDFLDERTNLVQRLLLICMQLHNLDCCLFEAGVLMRAASARAR